MNTKTTLAIIGRGRWGKIYKKTIDGMSNIALPKKYIYGKNYKELQQTDTDSIDGVIIAVSTSAHYDVASYLLKQGFKNLLIEKPLTQTYYQAKKLHKLLQAIPNSKVLVGHTLLYDPAYIKMKEVAQKELGKIFKIEYFSLKTPPIQNATVIQDAGSPPIYLFLDFAGKNPIKVSAKPKKDDNVELILEFENGLVAVASIGSVNPTRKRKIVITGEKGKLTLNEFINPRDLMYIQSIGKKQKLSFSTIHTALEEEIQEFVSSITEKIKQKTPYDCGIDVVKIIEVAEKSFKKNGEPLRV